MEHVSQTHLDHMRRDGTARPGRATRRVHPALYGVIFGAFAWIVLASLVGFGSGAESYYLLAIVALFLGVSAGIPGVIAVLRRHWSGLPGADRFARWVARDVETASGPLRGGEALLQAATGPVSLAVAMTLFAIVAGIVG